MMFSIYQSIAKASKPFEALTIAASLGGDADTTAAMTGAAMGALHGDEFIPRELWSNLKNHRLLSAMGEHLWAAYSEEKLNTHEPNLFEMEHQLTVEEYQEWLGRFGE